ncbi:hypothetical protein J1N35_037025 [Gossypium stocksii]|uniref:Zinc knuckle CX2CX4HX4C domain-containing protein n=1 Tax=Gossypium stocksii TaxID=47602 RepID=A0A9D3UJE8_9ROSI|nr:hypothetical protein J1N35_037025 [Gossypium stocksii]
MEKGEKQREKQKRMENKETKEEKQCWLWLGLSRVVTLRGMERDEISLLEEELIQLSVKNSLVVSNGKPTLLCTVKVGPFPSECDRKDLMHAIGSTFGGVLRSEVKGDFCRIEVQMNVQKPLRRGIFILTKTQEKVLVHFKYENLSGFFFGCSRMEHSIKECTKVTTEIKNLPEDKLPYSLALKAKINLLGRESLKLGFVARKSMKQWSYTRVEVENGKHSEEFLWESFHIKRRGSGDGPYFNGS